MKLTMQLVSDENGMRKYASVERSVWDADKPAGLVYVNMHMVWQNRLTNNPYQPIIHKEIGYKWAHTPCWTMMSAVQCLNTAWAKEVDLHDNLVQ